MKVFKKLFLFSFLVLGIGVLTSCSSSNASSTGTPAGGETITIPQENGDVNVVKNPKTIVTFDYGALDILDNLDVDVKGVPKASLPTALREYNDARYVDVGDLKEPDFETINSLKPDLIIIGNRQADMYEKFSEIAPTILLSIDGSKYIEDLERNANILGTLFGKENEVREEINDIKNNISELNRIVSRQNATALTLLVNEGSISTYGDKSRFGLIYTDFGFIPADLNIEESTHGQQVSFEYVVDKNPDYIFVIDRGSVVTGQNTARAVLDNDLIRATNAYKNGNIVYLNSEAWYVIAGGFDSTNVMIDDIKDFIEKDE